MIQADKAVEKIEDDSLGRKSFAKRVAKEIIGWKSSDSLVVGLYAKWGDGKTSLINFIKDLYINPNKFGEKVDTKSIPTVIEFNPWIFSNQGTLIQNFLLEVGKELGQRDNNLDKEIAKKIGLIRLYLEPAGKLSKKLEIWVLRAVVPFLGLSVASILNILLSNPIVFYCVIIFFAIIEILILTDRAASFLESRYSKKASLTEKTLNQIKEEIKQKLIARKSKILFIIDDVDRLTPDEVRTLFQLIKINLDLPNLIYLVAMDVNTVGKMIGDGKVNGSQYIEKIVQIPLPLPKASEKKLSEFLFNELDKVLTFFGEDTWDKERWASLYHDGFGKIFLKRGNLRIIKRSITPMIIDAGLISSDVDPIDFLGIRAIEHFYPDLYNYIADNKDHFTSTNNHRDYESKKMMQIRQDVEAELTKVEPYVKNIILELFPTLRSIIENYSYADSTVSEWRQSRRICSPTHFDTYFYIEVPEGEFRSFEIKAILSEFISYESTLKVLDEYINKKDNKDIRKLLTTLLDYVKELPQEEKQAASFLTALLDQSDELATIEQTEFFDFGAEMDMNRLIYFFLKNFKDEQKVSRVVKVMLEQTKSLYGAIHFLALNDRRERGGSHSNAKEWIIPKDKIEELEKICVKKIKTAQTKGNLKDHKQLVSILFRWKEWGDEKDVQKFINGFKRSRIKLARLLTKFKTYTLKSSGLSTKRIDRIDFNSLKEFIDLSYVKEKFEGISLAKFSSEEQESIKLFLNDLSKKEDLMY